MADVVQDVLQTGTGFDFTGSPINGVNRLVTTFSIFTTTDVVVQDSFTGSVPDIIQDELG